MALLDQYGRPIVAFTPSTAPPVVTPALAAKILSGASGGVAAPGPGVAAGRRRRASRKDPFAGMDPYTGQPIAAAAAPAKRAFGQRGPLDPAEKARRQAKAAKTRAAKKAATAGMVAGTPAAAQAAANATGQPVAVAGTTQVAKPGGRRRGGRRGGKPGLVTRVAQAVGVGGGRSSGRRGGRRKTKAQKANERAQAQAAMAFGGAPPATTSGRGSKKAKAEGGTARSTRKTKGEGTSFYRKHNIAIRATILVAGAASVNQVDSLIKARPLGENVSPSLMAIPVLLLGAWGTRKYGGKGAKPISDSMVALSVGLGTGNLLRAITQRSGGGVSGASLEGTQPEQQLGGGEPLDPTPEP